MNELELVKLLLEAKRMKRVEFSDIAAAIGRSKEMAAAVIYRQALLSPDGNRALLEVLGLSYEISSTLDIPPIRGGLQPVIPTDPTIYSLYEIVSLYGMPIKALINEEFGDGIMSTTDFNFTVERELDPRGDRVKVILNGKFMPFTKF